MIHEITPGSDVFNDDFENDDLKKRNLRNAIFLVSKPKAYKRDIDIYKEMNSWRVSSKKAGFRHKKIFLFCVTGLSYIGN